MRDPKRIKPLLKLIEEMWKKYPDLRLTQLMSVAANKYGWKGNDLFYFEDDNLTQGILIIEKELKGNK